MWERGRPPPDERRYRGVGTAFKFNSVPVPPLASRWRVILTPPLSGAQNMAVDVALMARARETGEAVFRVYTWATPTVSFGRNQTAVGRYDPERIRGRALDVVRRPTGGRAILHWHEVTYSVTAPAPDGVGLKHSYERINQLLLDGLARLGVPARIAAPAGPAMRPTAAPCFAAPSAGEMTTLGRKLVGSAQWRDHDALLQHGSILIDDDQPMLVSLALEGEPLAPPLPPAGTLREALGRAPEVREVAEALFEAVREGEDSSATALDPDAAVDAARAILPSFLDDQWTWRR